MQRLNYLNTNYLNHPADIPVLEKEDGITVHLLILYFKQEWEMYESFTAWTSIWGRNSHLKNSSSLVIKLFSIQSISILNQLLDPSGCNWNKYFLWTLISFVLFLLKSYARSWKPANIPMDKTMTCHILIFDINLNDYFQKGFILRLRPFGSTQSSLFQRIWNFQ